MGHVSISRDVNNKYSGVQCSFGYYGEGQLHQVVALMSH
jgi:hypothetical protein